LGNIFALLKETDLDESILREPHFVLAVLVFGGFGESLKVE